MQSEPTDSVSSKSETSAQPATPFVPRLRKPHPLISRTKYKNGGCERPGHVLRNDHEGVDVRVSKAMFHTALSILDLLFKELETRNIEIDNQAGYNGGTYARRGQDHCEIVLKEHFHRADHVMTAQEKARADKYSWDRPPKWDFLPTGELSLVPGGTFNLQDDAGVRAQILDAASTIEQELERKKSARESEERRRHEEWERQQRIEHEKKKRESMLKSAQKLLEYRLLLAYIEEVRRVGRIPADQIEPGQTLEQWLAWAEERVRRLHPLR